MSQLLKWSAALAICRHVHAYGGHHDSTLLLVNKCMHANCCNAITSWQYILSRSQSPTNSQLQLQSYSYSWLSFLYCPHALLTHPMPHVYSQLYIDQPYTSSCNSHLCIVRTCRYNLIFLQSMYSFIAIASQLAISSPKTSAILILCSLVQHYAITIAMQLASYSYQLLMLTDLKKIKC